MSAETSTYLRAASLAEVQKAGRKTVPLAGHVILLVWHEGQVFAVDNRCPHMGFPLERGSVRDGVLTCHWHHARFDLCSGGTFDPFADDLRSYPTRLQGGDIWVDPRPRRDELAYQQARLQDGLEQNLDLVIAKSVISLLDHGAPTATLLRLGGNFGAGQRQAGWRDGLTILTAMGNLNPDLAPADRPLALYHGLLHVADNVAGQRPHFPLEPLPTLELSAARLKGWLRNCAEVRDRDGVERVLLTALHGGLGPREVADMLLAAVTDHAYLDGGHSIDFVNKACELLDLIGWDHAPQILPSIVPALTAATRMEETNSWRNPVDLPGLLAPTFERLLAGELAEHAEAGGPLEPPAFDALTATLLGDDPEAIVASLADALTGGAAPSQLALAVSYAAALRIARFHTSNEFGDWIAVLHTFSAAHASYRLLQRAPSLEGARSIWHAAMHLYLNRFLNVPAAPQPSARSVAHLSRDADALLAELLELTEARQRVDEAAAVTYRYLEQGHDDTALTRTLAHLLLREDGEFHSYQLLEAGLRLHRDLEQGRPDLAPDVLVAVARYLAGHAPTDRASTQTYRIAARLHAGEALAAEASA